MARSRIPDALTRRHLIEKDLSAEQCLAIADAYLEEQRVVEAVVFLGKAHAHDRLHEIAEAAIEEGDAFLLEEVARARGRQPERGEWERLEDAARAAGKLRFAEDAHRQAHRGDD